MQDRQRCPLCQRHDIVSYLHTYQINLDEAVSLCENKTCLYPVGFSSGSNGGTFSRNLSEVGPGRDSVERVPSAQLTLQTQMAPHQLEQGQRVQRVALSTQTCSPLSVAGGLFNIPDYKPLACPTSKTLVAGTKEGNCKRSTPEFPGFEFGEQKPSGNNQIKPSKSNFKLKQTETCVKNDLQSDGKPLKFTNGSHDRNPRCNGIYSNNCNANNGLNNSIIPRNLSDKTLLGKDHSFAGYRCIKQEPVLTELFPQWLNKDALCWLDVVLCLLVHNRAVWKAFNNGKIKHDCVIYKLLKAHEQARSSLNNKCKEILVYDSKKPEQKAVLKSPHLSAVNRKDHNKVENIGEINGIKIGAGSELCQNKVTEMKHVAGMDMDVKDVVKMKALLDTTREEVWESLKARLKCEKGQKDSPVFALPLLLQQSPVIEKLFCMSYRFTCSRCKHEDENEYQNLLPTFPSTIEDFSMEGPQHRRACFRCGHQDGIRTMKYKKLPSCLLMHFVEGLPNIPWSKLEFSFHGNAYTVTGIVQYVNKPDHFIAWLRNPTTNCWAKCDDLGSLVSQFESEEPSFPCGQVHIVMWERVLPLHKAMNGVEKEKNTAGLSKKSVICLKNCESSGKTYLNTNGNCSANYKNIKCGQCIDCCVQDSCKHTGAVPGVPYSNAQFAMFPGAIRSEYREDKVITNPASILGTQAGNETAVSKATSVSRSSTPCSSLSSYSDTSTESVHLPMFTMSTQENCGLVKPVPCKMDVLGLKPSKTGADTYSKTCDSSDNETSAKNLPGKYGQAVSVLRMVKGGRGKRSNSSDSIKSHNEMSNGKTSLVLPKSDKHSSAFQAAPKTKGKRGRDINAAKHLKMNDSASVSFISAANTASVQENSSAIKHHSNSEQVCDSKSSSLLESKFKLPNFRKPGTITSISKDAFQTISRGTLSGTDNSPGCSSNFQPTGSPSLGGVGSYLSAVKQYLIGKTTGSSEIKCKFEGLNLKTAPQLKRSTNLTGLELSSPSSVVPNGLSYVNSLVKREAQTTRVGSESGYSARKRLSAVTNPSCPKVSRTEAVDSLNKKDSTKSEKSISSITKLAQIVKSSKSYTRKQGLKNVELVRKVNVKSERSLPLKFNNCQIMKENGRPEEARPVDHGSQHAFEVECNSKDSEIKCDTDSVLQDLYDALNIPFKEVPDTMSDIMMDVNDILGIVDTCRLVPEQDMTPTGPGNQASLDCKQY